MSKKKHNPDTERYGMPFRLKDSVIDMVKQIDPHTTRPMNTKLEKILKSHLAIIEYAKAKGIDLESFT